MMRTVLAPLLLLVLLSGCTGPDEGTLFGTILAVEPADGPSEWSIDLDQRDSDEVPQTLRDLLMEASQSNGTASRHITDMDDPVFRFLEEERQASGAPQNEYPTLRHQGEWFQLVQYYV